MNYYPLLPNYPRTFSIPSFPCPQFSQKAPQILMILSEALRKSINNYSISCIHTKPKTNANQLQIRKQTDQLCQNTILTDRKNDQEGKKIILKREEKEKNMGKIVILENAEEKHHLNSSQHATSDVIIPEIIAQNMEKKTDFCQLLNKPKSKQTKQHFEVNVPSISLIETAKLPLMKINEQELKSLKNRLLERKVDCWNQKLKNRRDKREIRMLNM